MKYASLPEADCRVIDMVKSDMVTLGRQLQFYATPSVILGFMIFRKSSNTTPDLTPTRLGNIDKGNGNWYTDLALSVGTTTSY